MAFTNYQTVVLRASAATSGTSEQDTQVALPETVKSLFVRVQKTAEANADNLLTVRLQCLVNTADWVDVSATRVQLITALTVAADTAATTNIPNIVDASNSAGYTYVAFYEALPSNIVRIVSVSSGTTPANTFEADAMFRVNDL